MAINEFHEGKTLPAEWFDPKALREAAWMRPWTIRLARATVVPTPPAGTGSMAASSASQEVQAPGTIEALYQVSCEVFDALEAKKKNPGFQDAGEVECWVRGLREVSIDEPGWTAEAEFADKLSVLLLKRLEQFKFKVEFELADRFQSHQYQYLAPLRLGGPSGLVLTPHLRDDRFRGFVVEGVVHAGVVGWAIDRVEMLIDELSGALRALGLARIVSLPGREFTGMGSPEGHPQAMFEGGQWRGEALRLDPGCARTLGGLLLTIPEGLDDLGRRLLSQGKVGEALEPQQRLLQRLFASASENAAQVRGACRRMIQAELTKDYGLAVTLAFSTIEGLLLEASSKEEVLGRLSEAVAHSVGRSPEHRAHLRKRVKALYDARSKFVHTGTARQASSDREEALELGYRVLRGEMAHLRDAEASPAESG